LLENIFGESVAAEDTVEPSNFLTITFTGYETSTP